MKRRIEFRVGERILEMQAEAILEEREINSPVSHAESIKTKIANFLNMPVSDFNNHNVALTGHVIIVSDKI